MKTLLDLAPTLTFCFESGSAPPQGLKPLPALPAAKPH
jgi:hypothetical protein